MENIKYKHFENEYQYYNSYPRIKNEINESLSKQIQEQLDEEVLRRLEESLRQTRNVRKKVESSSTVGRGLAEKLNAIEK